MRREEKKSQKEKKREKENHEVTVERGVEDIHAQLPCRCPRGYLFLY